MTPTPFVQQSIKNPQVQPDKIRSDCCDYCMKVDGDLGKELDACTKMTKRCGGDSCSRCKACKDFAKGSPAKKPINVGWL